MITIDNVTYRRSFADAKMIKRFLPLLTHGLFAQKRDVPSKNSKTILFRGFNSLSIAESVVPLTEGQTPLPTMPTVTDLSAVLNQYGAFMEYSDVVIDTVDSPFAEEIAMLAGEQAAQSLDAVTREKLQAGTSVQYASSATSRATVSASMLFTLAEAREAVRTMKGNNVPRITQIQLPNGNVDTIPGAPCYIALCHPNTTYDLKDDPDFVPVQNYPSQNGVLPGEVGRLDELRFIETTAATAFEGAGAGGVDVYPTIIIGADSYGISRITGKELEVIVHNPGSSGASDPLNQRGSRGWKSWFTAVILRQLGILRVEHGCSIDA